jgi:hypothetical protein
MCNFQAHATIHIGAPDTISQIQDFSVSKEDALAKVKTYFAGDSVNYYLIEEVDSMKNWKLFVDPNPLQGWTHQCYLFNVSKRKYPVISQEGDLVINVSTDTLNMPPANLMTPMDLRDFYGSNRSMKLRIKKSTTSNLNNTAAEKTKVVIISGGVKPSMNYERYWNDCSLIYQILRNKYGIPKNNIFVAMSDGTNTAVDMLKENGTYVSSPLDLDYDGVADIEYAASYKNLRSIFSSLYSGMNKGDHLFVYVTDHGSQKSGGHAAINLWDGDELTDTQFASWLSNYTKKGINVNVVLGQCYSGAFVNALSTSGCVVSSACSSSEVSSASPLVPYDEYLYRWSLAVNEANPSDSGAAINSDTDNNGRVTMLEAYNYAKKNDSVHSETPKYSSLPRMIGEDLSFDMLPDLVNLYIRDTSSDTGKEPCVTDNDWNSPDIWVRNEIDGGTEHENPYATSDHICSYIYVNVRNRSRYLYHPTTDADKRWLHIYWAQASTGLTKDAWMGKESYNTDNPTGGHLISFPLDSIEAGGVKKYMGVWQMPQVNNVTGTNEDFHYCILARITNYSYDDLNAITDIYYLKPKEDRTIAQKNLSIVNSQNLSHQTSAYVRNVHNSTHKYSLQVRPHTTADAMIFDDAYIYLTMSDSIYSAWQRGGSIATDITKSRLLPKRVRFNSSKSELSNIILEKGEFDKVSVRCSFKSSGQKTKYAIDLVQFDEEGNIVGGETFYIYPPTTSATSLEISSENVDGNLYKLSSNVDGADYDMEWLDSDEVEIGDAATVVVDPLGEDSNYTLYALSEDGELSSATISLTPNIGINSVSYLASQERLIVNLKSTEGSNPGTLVLAETQNGLYNNTINLQEGQQSIDIDTSDFPSGIYAVSYVYNGIVINFEKFNKL